MDSCKDIATLRTIEPTKDGQFIMVISYYSDWLTNGGKPSGGGPFVALMNDKTSPDDNGEYIVTKGGHRWHRVAEQLLPVDFGCTPGGTKDCTQHMRAYLKASANKTVVFQNGPWRVSGTLDFTLIKRIMADDSGRFKINPKNFDGDYALIMGDPTDKPNSGRSSRLVIDGDLVVDCDSRDTELNGVYIKGQWFVGGHIRVSGFNGTGINMDSVWDSTFERLSVERCGNLKKWALEIGSSGDTFNATHINSIQCEQAYHRGIFINNNVRNVFDNIHAERLIVLTEDDGTTGLASGLKYQNHSIIIGNSTINQVFMDAALDDSTTGQKPGVTTKLSVNIGTDRAEIRNFNAASAVCSTSYGTKSVFSSCRFGSWYIAAPASHMTLAEPEIDDLLMVERDVTIINPTVEKLDFRYNAQNVKIIKGELKDISLTSNILGNITFYDTKITGKVNGTKVASNGYMPVTFNNCIFTGTFAGAYQSTAIVNGGHIATAALVSGASVQFYNVTFDSFSCTGNISFISRGCQAKTVSGWKNPNHTYPVYPAGTVNERIGKAGSGNGILYVNADGTPNGWKMVVTMP